MDNGIKEIKKFILILVICLLLERYQWKLEIIIKPYFFVSNNALTQGQWILNHYKKNRNTNSYNTKNLTLIYFKKKKDYCLNQPQTNSKIIISRP